MEDGEGSLEDGTKFKRESGESKGKNGYWYRWTKLSGISPAGQVSSQDCLKSSDVRKTCTVLLEAL